jgi:hypothetical protein
MRFDPIRLLAVTGLASGRQTVLHRAAGPKSTISQRGDQPFVARHGLSAIENAIGEPISRRSPPRIR